MPTEPQGSPPATPQVTPTPTPVPPPPATDAPTQSVAPPVDPRQSAEPRCLRYAEDKSPDRYIRTTGEGPTEGK